MENIINNIQDIKNPRSKFNLELIDAISQSEKLTGHLLDINKDYEERLFAISKMRGDITVSGASVHTIAAEVKNSYEMAVENELERISQSIKEATAKVDNLLYQVELFLTREFGSKANKHGDIAAMKFSVYLHALLWKSGLTEDALREREAIQSIIDNLKQL